jgi:hypothetical protein
VPGTGVPSVVAPVPRARPGVESVARTHGRRSLPRTACELLRRGCARSLLQGVADRPIAPEPRRPAERCPTWTSARPCPRRDHLPTRTPHPSVSIAPYLRQPGQSSATGTAGREREAITRCAHGWAQPAWHSRPSPSDAHRLVAENAPHHRTRPGRPTSGSGSRCRREQGAVRHPWNDERRQSPTWIVRFDGLPASPASTLQAPQLGFRLALSGAHVFTNTSEADDAGTSRARRQP